jgi:UDP-N-acetylglucosamine--N-acetylmuramyl-(pentapeptide) pyrophosphoryl-undecaprenol N-acetylglucosamine transferase
MPKADWVGNPLRESFVNQAPPAVRYAQRSGPLRVLVVGGSLGAQALNTLVPQALALMPVAQRPQVTHQSGAKQIDALRQAYASAGVQAELTPFIEDTAQAFGDADLVIARAGASTVTELAAVGVAALFVPFPHAVDDHQTTNAQFLVNNGGGWLVQQAALTAQDLAQRLQTATRDELLVCAEKAYAMRKTNATQDLVHACEALATQRGSLA